MIILRNVLACLAIAIALLALAIGLATVPAVQTWAARTALSERPDLQGSLGSLRAGFENVDATDLRLTLGGGVLTVPSLHAELPVLSGLRNRRLLIRDLEAKGWTLDLTQRTGAGSDAVLVTTAAPQAVGALIGGILGGWALPCDAAIDRADLEGDILCASPYGGAPLRIHVTAKGGGFAAGKSGVFEIEAAGSVLDSNLTVHGVSCRGRLTVAMDTPRTVGRMGIDADITSQGGPFPDELGVSAEAVSARREKTETYTLNLRRGSRPMAAVTARLSEASGAIAGTWKLDANGTDLAAAFPDHPLPSFSLSGDGAFDTDTGFSRVHATGRLASASSRWDAVAPALDRLGTVTANCVFDATQEAGTAHVERLRLSAESGAAALAAEALQPFEVDERTADFKPADPARDGLRISARDFPLDWLPDLGWRLAIGSGHATGEGIVRVDNGGFALRSVGPIVVSGISLRRGATPLLRGIDLAFPFTGDVSSDGWHAQSAAIDVRTGGRELASLEGKASRIGDASQPIALSLTWRADLDAFAGQPAFAEMGPIHGRSASGTVSASLGTPSAIQGDLKIAGHDPSRILTSEFRADVDPDGTISFAVPMKLAFLPAAPEISIQGYFNPTEAGTSVSAKISADSVDLGAFSPAVVAGLVEAGNAGVSDPGYIGKRPRLQSPSPLPFWGAWSGSVSLDFDHLKASGRALTGVVGTIDFDRGSLRLEGGRAVLGPHSAAAAAGTLAFDADAPLPYRLNATASIDRIEAAPDFAAKQAGDDPSIEGRFAVQGTFTGAGSSPNDLIGRTRSEYRFSSTDGIVRVFKTNVADVIPQVNTPVKDTVGEVGSVVGAIFGHHGSGSAGKNPVTKTADAVMNFTYEVAEIGYDTLEVDAVREPGGAIRLVKLTMNAPDERVTGSGTIAWEKGVPLRLRPLSADLQFSARNGIAKLLKTAGLLSPAKDSQGYFPLTQAVHFGGTLDQIDGTAWHDLLAKAATRIPPGGK